MKKPIVLTREPTLEEVERFYERLPPLEVAVFRIMNDPKKPRSQAQAAKELGISQPSISIRLSALRTRISVLRQLPVVHASNFERDMQRHMPDEEIRLLKAYWNGKVQANRQLLAAVSKLAEISKSTSSNIRALQKYAAAFQMLVTCTDPNVLFSPNFGGNTKNVN